MSTANRLKNKAKMKQKSQEQTVQSTQQNNQTEKVVNKQPYQFPKSHENYIHKRPKIFAGQKHTKQDQEEYEQYYPIKQANPIGIQFSMGVFPHNFDMFNQFNLPLGFTFSPTLAMENQNATVMPKCINVIPRCGVCFAFMNCYNRFEDNNKKYQCFICGSLNYAGEYKPQSQINEELNTSIYQAHGADGFYPNIPGQQCFVFLIDINYQAAQCRMLQFAVSAMKQAFSRPELDDTIIYLYIYDETVYQLDFTGEETKCTVIDHTIQQRDHGRVLPTVLKDCRDKLIDFLDIIEQISQNNPKKGSNFTYAFEYVFKATKNTGAKYFILQANQAIGGQAMMMQQVPKKMRQQDARFNPIPPRSPYETKNKLFFDKFTSEMFNNGNSISLFFFSRGHKNLKVFNDCLKITNSECKCYAKDSEQQLNRFYYQLIYFLTCTYIRDVKTQFLISDGWHFTTVYGNTFRVKQRITFLAPYIDPTKKYLVLMSPSKNANKNKPHCTIQLVINYRYKKQHFTSVATALQNVTGFAHKMYGNIDEQICIASIMKGFLTNLRSQTITVAKKKLAQVAYKMYGSASQFFKSQQKIPYSIITIISSTLSMLKSMHSQPQLMANSLLFDKIIAQRNFIQFCGSLQIHNMFIPYVFALSEMNENMCRTDIDFQYPPTVQAKFQNVKQGLFLLDDGLSLYIFIAKTCDQILLKKVFGKQKFAKNDIINEQTLNQQTSFEAEQIKNLIQLLRQQKSFGYAPLYVVRCGQNSMTEKNFYLHFYTQRYDQFKNYKYSLQDYIALLKRNSSQI